MFTIECLRSSSSSLPLPLSLSLSSSTADLPVAALSNRTEHNRAERQEKQSSRARAAQLKFYLPFALLFSFFLELEFEFGAWDEANEKRSKEASPIYQWTKSFSNTPLIQASRVIKELKVVAKRCVTFPDGQ